MQPQTIPPPPPPPPQPVPNQQQGLYIPQAARLAITRNFPKPPYPDFMVSDYKCQ